MSAQVWVELIAALVLVGLMALASWVEMCVGSVTRLTIRELLDDRASRAQDSELLASQRIRSAMLVIQVVAVVVVAGLVVQAFQVLEAPSPVFTGAALTLAMVLIIGRIVPRAIAGQPSSPTSPGAMRVGGILRAMFLPVVWPVEMLGERLSARDVIAEAESEESFGPQDAESRTENGAHAEDELKDYEMISGILQLDRATADDIMVPRLDIVAIPRESTIEEAVNVAIEAGHSRIPVYGDNIDEIVGIIYAKDLLKYVTEDKASAPIEEEIRPAHFVPESKRVDDLLAELQQAKIHMAIVVDEYGGTAGIVTIEDILEEIVGEIEDEYDKEVPQIERISDEEVLVDGRLLLEEIYDELELEWIERPQGTVAGLIQRELGRIPKAGDIVEVPGMRLTVESVERRRVRQVRAERVVSDEVEDPSETRVTTG